jgi:hypothetical protein
MKRLLTLAAVAAALSAACGDKASNTPAGPTPTPPAPTSPAPAATRVIGLTGDLHFGDVPVGSSVTADFTISNSGNSALTVNPLDVGGLSTVLLTNWSGGTLAPGASQLITIQFAPVDAEAFSGVLSFASNATGGTSTIFISGTSTSVTPVTLPIQFLRAANSSQDYLGFLSCVFCVEANTNSINNFVGAFGSQFSATSVRNKFSTYGSASSDFSACNPQASHPPKVLNEYGDYVGELTLNESRAGAVTSPEILNWLRTSVCRH